MSENNFFNELKRRNVYKVAIAYVVVAWLVAQIAGLAASSFAAPVWVMKMFIVFLIIGLPITLILAWAFEMSPQGIIRTSSVAAEENPYPVHKKKPLTSNVIIGILILIVGGQFVYNKYWISGGGGKAKVEKSIAVLPFKNLSSEKGNDFFCAGVMESILDNLAKIKGLKVISRTSIERYSDRTKSAAEIADELDVSYILEGSVFREQDKVRIFTKLILADANQQKWSRTFDRQLTDIFAVQSEISENIVDQLNIELFTEKKVQFDQIISRDLEAYDYYLKGRENMVQFHYDRNQFNYDNALLNFQKALQLDSLLARAYSDIAYTYYIDHRVVFPGIDYPHLNDIEKLCRKALSINSSLPQAHSLLGISYLINEDEEGFVEEQYKALEINPNYAFSNYLLGRYYSRALNENLEKGLQFLEKAIALDPYSSQTSSYYRGKTIAFLNLLAFEHAEYYAKKELKFGGSSDFNYLIHSYLMQGKYEQVESLGDEWLNDSSSALRLLAEVQTNYYKNYNRAIELFEEFLRLNPQFGHTNQRLGLAYWLNGNKEKGKELLEMALKEYESQQITLFYDWCYDVAGIQAIMGNHRMALDLLNDENCKIYVGLESYATHDPFFKDLWDNPEFKAIIKRRKTEKKHARDRILKILNFQIF